MPDVKIYMPTEIYTPGLVWQLQKNARVAVASHLDCSDYDGKPLNMTPHMIDVRCFTHPADAIVGSVLIIEIIGYDYPERMASISYRLREILRDIVPVNIENPRALHRGSISFIPISNGCWQST